MCFLFQADMKYLADVSANLEKITYNMKVS